MSSAPEGAPSPDRSAGLSKNAAPNVRGASDGQDALPAPEDAFPLWHQAIVNPAPDGKVYVVVQNLDCGGYGVVLLVEDRATKERFAMKKVKEINADMILSAKREERALRICKGEAHVVQVVEAFSFQETPRQKTFCIVMELAPHGDLDDWLAEYKSQYSVDSLPLPLSKEIMRQLV
uniref:Protein kinase domain-containing protein n=1 Tax=Chromera velia CCMP2878 TaxID=1169474 RepID=A0A0G4FPV3_9ALVE|mmetsp:Transcript_437/g.976  ORF Transcript_437/g.976 Transcript_437/m.976 type:complete len:177 (+) Transcript_437:74-604(+)|eukprot:Cvel_18045.t1-p1 / transcript=Cvel_18045.t1 / gene=Cvel_18045 / organism=Chromera_velia_CCMP2878 / gene_product=hypothetical protein / transcript_product=hypothetical protein / location=Cvel_scaffold1473:42878-43405(-) / protein_length=176 / sequence_SO=supercontig / SO=protein_coding / is_pseudo=false